MTDNDKTKPVPQGPPAAALEIESINEPPGSNVLPPTEPQTKPADDEEAEDPDAEDPDELEDEIDQAVADGDAKVHRGTPSKTLPHKKTKR